MIFPRFGTTRRLSPLRVGTLFICVLAAVDAIAFASVAGEGSQQAATPQSSPQAVRAPDSTQPSNVDGQQPKPNVATASDERRKQISEDSATLLKLATDLKAEVDKTTKDTLSIGVIRKADAIEKLAHAVKEQTRPAAGPN